MLDSAHPLSSMAPSRRRSSARPLPSKPRHSTCGYVEAWPVSRC